jgi:hypothetical protein
LAEALAARYARRTRLGWLIYLGLWALVGVVLLVVGALVPLRGLWTVGLPIVLVFTWLLVLAARRFADPRPVIAVGQDGFHDRRLGQAIPWEEIRALKRQANGNRVFLQIEVAEPARYLGNAGWLARPMLILNPKMGFPVLSSNLSGMDVPQERMASAAASWWNRESGG